MCEGGQWLARPGGHSCPCTCSPTPPGCLHAVPNTPTQQQLHCQPRHKQKPNTVVAPTFQTLLHPCAMQTGTSQAHHAINACHNTCTHLWDTPCLRPCMPAACLSCPPLLGEVPWLMATRQPGYRCFIHTWWPPPTSQRGLKRNVLRNRIRLRTLTTPDCRYSEAAQTHGSIGRDVLSHHLNPGLAASASSCGAVRGRFLLAATSSVVTGHIRCAAILGKPHGTVCMDDGAFWRPDSRGTDDYSRTRPGSNTAVIR